MLSPTWPLTPYVLGAALLLVLALFAFRAARRSRIEYARFKTYTTTAPRQKQYRKWLIESFVFFGGLSLLILLLSGGYVGRLLAAVRQWPVGVWFSGLIRSTGFLVPGIAIGFAVLLIVGTVLAVFFARNSGEVPSLGDVAALLPRNREELGWGALLSLNAGLVEELMFRLALPALVFGVTGNAVVAVVAALVVFGALHAYQGVTGVVVTMIVGGLFMALYLATGSIVVAMVAHALVDLRSFVLIPTFVYRVQAKTGDEVEVATGAENSEPVQ